KLRQREREHVLVQVGIAALVVALRGAVAFERRVCGGAAFHQADLPPRTPRWSRSQAASAKAAASSPAKPSTCRPSGMPAISNSGSEMAGTPSSEEGTANCGFPVACKPAGAAPGAERVRQPS